MPASEIPRVAFRAVPRVTVSSRDAGGVHELARRALDTVLDVLEARDDLEQRSPLARERFGPFMRELAIVSQAGSLGGALDGERLLGWTIGPHVLLG